MALVALKRQQTPRRLMKTELERMYKEMVMLKFETVSRYLAGGSELEHENPRHGSPSPSRDVDPGPTSPRPSMACYREGSQIAHHHSLGTQNSQIMSEVNMGWMTGV
jgi:hypothetical protein